MRFVFLFSGCVIALSAFALPAKAQSYPRAETVLSSERDPMALKRRVAGPLETPHLIDGFYAERVAGNIGDVSAITTDNEGSLYALSADDGQIIHLFDRGLDGRMDTQRALAQGFQRPTGLALDAEQGQLYISDQTAIWRVETKSGAVSEFVSLRNMSAAEQRPLALYKGRLLLGISKTATTSSVLSIDLQTGIAAHLTDLSEAPIRALSHGGGQLWAAVGQSLRPVELGAERPDAKRYLLEAGAAAVALLLPSPDIQHSKDWPASLKGAVIAAQGPTHLEASYQGAQNKSSGGNNIVILPTQFGAPTSELTVFVGGFLSRDGRTAWAAPSAFAIDRRGLFFADRLGKSLWRVSVDNRPPPKPRARITEPLPKPPTQKPSRAPNETIPMAGSQIGPASRLNSASTLQVGSYLKKEHDEKEAAKLAAEKAEEEAETKAKADAREARRLRNGGRPDTSPPAPTSMDD